MSLFGFGDVKPGDDGPEVSVWKGSLLDLGYDVDTGPLYDDATWSATVAFKESVGLPANGVVDAATQAAMNRTLDVLADSHTIRVDSRRGAAGEMTNILGQFEKLNWWVVGGVLAAAAGVYYWSKR